MNIKATMSSIVDTSFPPTPWNPNTEHLKSSSYGIQDSYLFAFCENGNVTSLAGQLNPFVKNWFHILKHTENKENFYNQAIINLIKKVDYLQLTMQYNSELINDEDFDNELDINEDKYLIKTNQDFKFSDFNLIIEILQKLNKEFTTDEIAEMFSISIETVNKYVDNHNNILL
jgi:hypothetical protein